MIEIINLVVQVVQCLTSPLGCQFGDNLRNYDSNFRKLELEVERLKTARERVKNEVKTALKNTFNIKKEVEPWQTEVESIIGQAEELIRKKEADNRCFKANLMKRHKHSKEASTKVHVIALLLEQRERFGEVYDPTPPPEIWHTSTADYEAFDSRKRTLENILNALKNDNIHMVVIWGMGGIGKTTLAKEADRQVRKHKLFKEVVFVEITETPDINKIQQVIADKLDLKFDKETERANKLYARLRNEERILVILDNIWPGINLKIIGIPSGDDRGGCKLLLTTRDQEVLRRMDSEAFHIGDLTGKEAWRLFKKKAGDDIEDPVLKPVATAVVKECGCLPIAIVTVAGALKKKKIFEWQDALQQLRRPSPENISPLLKPAYSKIEFSYNKLEGDGLKKTFLLCSLMTNNALISDLFNYVVGLDMLDGKTLRLEQARNRVKTWVRQLKDSCLLLDVDSRIGSFSMHDVVRDVAVLIACRHHHVFTVRNDDLREWPDNDTLKQCMKISMHGYKTVENLERLECPELEFFYMGTKNSSTLRIPENFFMAMAKLRVLHLPNLRLSSFPSSLCDLVNLQTLCLDNGIFEDVAIIGELKKLKILSLRCSKFKKLPSEIGQLAQLRLLDLSDCSQLEAIASNVISSLSRLEELYMRGCCCVQWEVKGMNVESGNACLEELCHSSQLTTLEIDIQDDKVLPTDFLSKELERYAIGIGQRSNYLFGWDWDWDFDFMHRVKGTSRRMLNLKLKSSICLKEKQNIKNAEALFLDEWQGEKDDLLSELGRDGFSQLKHLGLKNNHQFRCIVDSMNLVARDAFPALESLSLSNLSNLEEICRGQFTAESFSQLCRLTLRHLPQLRSFYSSASENNQEELTSSEGLSNEIVLENGSDINPTSLFNGKVVFSKLEALELNKVNVENIWDSQQSIMSSSYKNLTRLIVNNCQKLKYLFSYSMVKSLEQLQHLEISDCNALKEIVEDRGGAETTTCEFIFPQVTFIKFWCLPELTTFYTRTHTSMWPMLKKLEIGYCDKVNVLFFQCNVESQFHFSKPQSLFMVKEINPNLKKLTLGGKNITIMWQAQFPEHHFSKLKVTDEDDESTNIPLPILKNLEKLCLSNSWYKEIFSYEKYENYEGTPIQLKVLEIGNLSALKNIWKQDSKLDSLLQNLQILRVNLCLKLMNVLPPSASFQNLTILEVSLCYGLLNLITSSMAKSLKQLREMKIAYCQLLIEVVAKEEDLVKDEIVFNKLKLLSLENLESLISFCSGNHTFIFPSLEELIVDECPNMKNFSGGVITTPKLQKVRLSEEDMEGQWEGDLKKTIQNLHKAGVNSNSEKLILSGDDVRMIWQGQFPEHYSSGVKVLEVIKDESANIPLGILERFSNLETLILKGSSYKEIFSSEGGQKHGGTVPHIKELELHGLFYLKQMWQQDSQLNSVLQNLESLSVSYCHSLINLAPNSASFENLTSLRVWDCDGLRNLVTSSTAKSLVQLEFLCIRNCEMMIEIVENREDEGRDDEINFNNLRELRLDHLESLSSFCSGNYSFNFPALKELTRLNCPKMKVFSEGVLNTPKLQKVRHGWGDEACWYGDLNTTIKQLHKKRNVQICLEDLGEASTQPPV